MNRFQTLIAGLGLVAVALPAAASAAPWQSVNARQARLDARIDQGIRSGALTRGEAMRLRGEFRQISALEYRYRRSGGLSAGERRDLDRRFDALSARIRYDKHDRNDRRHYR
ncbi:MULTISPECIES: hypothetical protein [Sphingomonas]|jgi:hypothetical protein|uniref:DUF4148 domain-containing protein n=1 Tax=Sphingomonas adhaesiva TaxID=28212 RepID=A0A2A4I679_9SPHN|nr:MULTISPECIES: hypothetical protein [Sphingomonas]PCG13638.1 hypothetical protein COA07_14150 [Sphingomonas adhaesiva]PZU80522.1 MAG: hypothetical protein DI530_05365 [Sphingomonas sp.]